MSTYLMKEILDTYKQIREKQKLLIRVPSFIEPEINYHKVIGTLEHKTLKVKVIGIKRQSCIHMKVVYLDTLEEENYIFDHDFSKIASIGQMDMITDIKTTIYDSYMLEIMKEKANIAIELKILNDYVQYLQHMHNPFLDQVD